MNFYLLDKNLKRIEIIEQYRSFIWTNRYYTPGDFELYTPATKSLLSKIKRDYFIMRSDDLTQAMIIQNYTITTDVENGDYLTITGKSLKSILERRIIWPQTTINGNLETQMRKLVTQNAILPADSNRVISRLELGPTIGLTQTIKAQFTGDNLSEVLTEIGQTYGIGHDIKLDYANKKFKFVLLQGKNRSYNQSVNARVVFSNAFENLLTTNYAYNSENFKSLVFVAGEGQGKNRKTVQVGTGNDLNRFEIYLDARDVSSNDGAIGTNEYNQLLFERGVQELADKTINEEVSGEVVSNFTYKLNQNYYLGDIVEVRNDYGVRMAPRIIEVIECHDENGYTCVPTFSSDTIAASQDNIVTENDIDITTETGENIICEV